MNAAHLLGGQHTMSPINLVEGLCTKAMWGRALDFGVSLHSMQCHAISEALRFLMIGECCA
jgi:hypothetical protein